MRSGLDLYFPALARLLANGHKYRTLVEELLEGILTNLAKVRAYCKDEYIIQKVAGVL